MCECHKKDCCEAYKARIAELEKELEESARVSIKDGECDHDPIKICDPCCICSKLEIRCLRFSCEGYKKIIAGLQKELEESARLHGMGSEREAGMLARVAELMHERNEAIKTKEVAIEMLAEMKRERDVARKLMEEPK